MRLIETGLIQKRGGRGEVSEHVREGVEGVARRGKGVEAWIGRGTHDLVAIMRAWGEMALRRPLRLCYKS